MLFGFIPEALANTVKIAKQCNIEFETGGILIPIFELPEKDQIIYENALNSPLPQGRGAGGEGFIQKINSAEWYLRYLSFKGLNWRFDYGLDDETIFEFIKKLPGDKLKQSLQETLPDELKALALTYYTDNKKERLNKLTKNQQDHIERLEYELVVIHEMGFDGYFLIVADYINWARDNDIPVGPGRGSAAGSLMAFLSGITDIDPIKFGLIFERFLNPARVSMPDIDTDFADVDRSKVIDYCREKYGSDKVVQICTFGTFAARAAVKDVGRVMGIPFQEMNELVKLIPEKPGTKLKGALEDSFEFNEAYNENEQNKKIIDFALKIEGNTRQLGVHACAVIIAPEPVTNFCPLQHPPKDDKVIITQYSAYPLEDLGLLKMDFLGLRNLTIIKNTQKIVKNNKGDEFDILKVPLDDPKCFEIFANGDTTGVFQFESEGMRKYLKDLSPDTFEDLIAMVSLYRPGPLAYIPSFIERKYGREEVKYMTDDLREYFIEETGYSNEEINEEKDKLEGRFSNKY
ncbi:MAG: DNA polymerase III subunit alpha [Candidatus Gracilibacteria bacterium]|nr:DNA polymerase III subunit alpha [Candidatus Gracilibacteria bacterium]